MKGFIIAIVVIIVMVIGFTLATSTGDKMEGPATSTVSTVATTTQDVTPKAEGVVVGGELFTPARTIIENLSSSQVTSLFMVGIQVADFSTKLQGVGPYTVFVPTNNAFEKLGTSTINTLLKPESKTKLTALLNYHVVSGRYTSADLTDGQTLKTLDGKTLKITKTGGKIMVNSTSTVQTADIISKNGIIFVVDTVLMPSTK